MSISTFMCWIIGAALIAIGLCLIGGWQNIFGALMVWWGFYWFAAGKPVTRDKNWVE